MSFPKDVWNRGILIYLSSYIQVHPSMEGAIDGSDVPTYQEGECKPQSSVEPEHISSEEDHDQLDQEHEQQQVRTVTFTSVLIPHYNHVGDSLYCTPLYSMNNCPTRYTSCSIGGMHHEKAQLPSFCRA